MGRENTHGVTRLLRLLSNQLAQLRTARWRDARPIEFGELCLERFAAAFLIAYRCTKVAHRIEASWLVLVSRP